MNYSYEWQAWLDLITKEVCRNYKFICYCEGLSLSVGGQVARENNYYYNQQLFMAIAALHYRVGIILMYSSLR